MKKFLVLSLICMFVVPGVAATRTGAVGKHSVARTSVSYGGNQVTSVNNSVSNNVAGNDKGSVANNRDRERIACIGNNVGIGNTFVWASKYSNTDSYSSMIEDTNNPENNVCFVLVSVQSDDASIDTSDIKPKYFQWGNNVVCGSWIDEAKMESRILESDKTARVLGTVGGVVGGAGVGVGAMELFGNKLIGGAVQGQQQYADDKTSVNWYKTKACELKKKDIDTYNDFEKLAKELKQECKEYNDERCKDSKYANLIQWYDSARDCGN